MIRKLSSGGYRLYSRKVDPKTKRRRNLGTFKTAMPLRVGKFSACGQTAAPLAISRILRADSAYRWIDTIKQ